MINQHKEKKKNNNKRIFKRNFQIVVLICTLLIMLFSYNHCSLKLSDGQVTVAVISDNDEETVIDLILPIESDENVEDVDLVNESSSIISKAKFPLTDNEWRLLGKRVKMPEQGDMYAEVLNPKTIAITIVPIWDPSNNVFDRDLLDSEEVENESNFIISSSDDDNFSLGVEPSLSGLHRKPIFAPYQFEDFRMSERIFLKLEVPLKSEVDYTVKVLSNILGSEIDIEFSYINSQFSHAIHVNEQG